MAGTQRQPELREANVVVVGRWNPAILSPAWAARHGLVPSAAAEVDFTTSGLRLKAADLYWIPTDDRLLVGPGTPEDWQKAGAFASGVLELLNHTPVIGVGLNFHFALAGDLADQIASRAGLERGRLEALAAVLGGQAKGQTLTDVVRLPGPWGATLHLKLVVPGEGPLAIEMNFHHDVNTNEAAREAITHMADARQCARQVLDHLGGGVA